MPSRKNGADAKFCLENLKKLDSEEQVLVGLYFYESLTVDEISVILEKDSNDIDVSLRKILSKIVKKPAGKEEKSPLVSSDALR